VVPAKVRVNFVVTVPPLPPAGTNEIGAVPEKVIKPDGSIMCVLTSPALPANCNKPLGR
jgi:hypothetical protein